MTTLISLWFGLVGSVLAMGTAEAVEGDYVGKGSETAGYKWMLHAKIAPLPGGRYKAVVTSTNPTCASQTEGVGTLRGKVLQINGDECPMKITFNGRSSRGSA